MIIIIIIIKPEVNKFNLIKKKIFFLFIFYFLFLNIYELLINFNYYNNKMKLKSMLITTKTIILQKLH